MQGASTGTTREGRLPQPGTWLGLLAICLAVMGATDAAILQAGNTYFTGGFNGVYVGTRLATLGFFVAGGILDAAFVLGIWSLLLPWLKRLPGSRLQHFTLLALVTLAIPLLIVYLTYSLHYVVGDMVSPMLLWAASGRDSSEVASQVLAFVHPAVFAVLAASLGIVAALSLIARVERRIARIDARFEAPRTPLIWVAFPVALVIGTTILVTSAATAPRIYFGLDHKASTAMLTGLIQWVTDIDRDGFGLLTKPPDPAPFDAAIHPDALDRPGNGIDENGFGGDHPSGFGALQPIPIGAVAGPRRPQFLLIFLESFRADLVGARLGGQKITPFLEQLAAEGASSNRAFVHSPSTAASRAQLYGGRLIPHEGQRTLIDDFKKLGYTVAHFSGQDDSYGGSEPLLGVDRADHFYDARQDVDLRISRSSSKVSLQVSWKLVNQRALEYLAGADPEQPLFLYVNYTDTHYPYHHREIDDLLGIEPLSRGQVNKDHAERIWETYANTAANVDRGIEQLVSAWTEHFAGQELAIMVTADHAQEIFEHGFLGHGHALNPEQSQIPLVLWGIGGTWPEPIGLADVRGLLRRHLFATDRGPAHFVVEPGRQILQYAGHATLPFSLGLRSADDAAIYVIGDDRLSLVGPGDAPREASEDEARQALESLIWNWEGVRLRSADEESRP